MPTIRELREAQRMTQLELAFKAGVTPGTVSNWERGLTSPRPAQLRKVAEIFGVPVEEIERPKMKAA